MLDGLLHEGARLGVQEHYTDTAGFTDHVFALCSLLGFRFVPRMKDLGDRKLYTIGNPAVANPLDELIGGSVQQRVIEAHWNEVHRLNDSIREGKVNASLLVSKLAAYPRQHQLALALREIGRVERTLFILDWLQQPALRRRAHEGLNKGELRNSLARALRFYRRGSVNDTSYGEQDRRAGGLNLVVAAITLWNTVYLNRAVEALIEIGTT